MIEIDPRPKNCVGTGHGARKGCGHPLKYVGYSNQNSYKMIVFRCLNKKCKLYELNHLYHADNENTQAICVVTYVVNFVKV